MGFFRVGLAWRFECRPVQEEGSVAGIKSIGQSYIQGFAENLGLKNACVRVCLCMCSRVSFFARNLAYYAVVAKQDDRITEKPIVFELA